MVVGRRHWIILLLALLMILLLTACERPMASDEGDTVEADATTTAEVETDENEEPVTAEDEAEAETPAESPTGSDEEAEMGEEETQQESVAEEAESPDPDVGGGTPETAAEEAAESAETVPAEEAVETEEAESDEVTDESAESETAAETTTEAQEPAAEETDEDSVVEDEVADEATDEDETQAVDETQATSTLPATHTVAPGENLYRIGLKYGMSWVTLAAYNNLPNPNYIRVGQVLYIPGGGEPAPAPPIAPPDAPAYVDYVVQPGDTLYSIGRKFGVSWVEIAEANGIVNPNLIYAGQVLKIPTSQPETPPAVTHTVKSGETLYRISLQYGVHWLAIAQANQIAPPYVIYPGQVLVIPSG